MDSAAVLWRAGQPLEAGELIVAGLDAEQRARWAGRILDLAVSWLEAPSSWSTRAPAPVLEVLALAHETSRWGEAHRAFDAIRTLTLEADEKGVPDRLTYLLLFVAENTSKVLYNATLPRDPFDDDSAAWVSATIHALAVALGPDYEAAALRELQR